MSSPARAQGKNASQIPRRSMGIVCLGGKQGLVVMGPQSCVSAWKKSELPLGRGAVAGTGSVASLKRILPQKQKEKVERGRTFKLPNFPLKGVTCIVNSPGSIHYPSAALCHSFSSISSPTFPLYFPPAAPSFPLRLQFLASAFNRRGSSLSLLGE